MSLICNEVAVQWQDFDLQRYLLGVKPLPKRKGGKKRYDRDRVYLDLLLAFDIETSRVWATNSETGAQEEHAIMYIWQCQLDKDVTVYGRTWEEWFEFSDILTQYCLTLNVWAVVWVHNLSYEFQFLSGVFPVADKDVFAVKSRKVLRLDVGRMEYRDSYLQTNMSLELFCKKMKVVHQKLAGDLDYSKTRYPWTALSEQELAYCFNDVRGLVEAISAEMEADGDSLYTIPMTSTGYVRRDVKRAMYPILGRAVKPLLPGPELLRLLLDAFAGGDTHASRHYVGILLHNVKSADEASAYPAAQTTKLFPVTPFRREHPDPKTLQALLKRGRAVVMRLAFTNIRQKYDWWGFPAIPRHKCQYAQDVVADNGRILSASSIVYACTDLDFRNICKEYKWDGLRVLELWSAGYGRLPAAFREVIQKYYELKTTLKNVEGMEVLYTKSKNKLNSCYGMTAQKPVRDDVFYDGITFHQEPPENFEESVLEANKAAFLPYQWAVWTTAHARDALKAAQWAAGRNAVYCDTDSLKYLGDVDFSGINTEIRKRARAAGAFADDPKGKRHYMGVFEDEKPYAEFMTWGAKKYATTYEKGGPITTTIAGVNKTKGGPELMQHGGFSAFRPGFVFREAGGTDLIYNDDPHVNYLEVDGHKLHITKNVVIKDGEYTLGITAEYAKILGYEMEETT